MYTEHFKLKELPFRLTPDPQFLYLSKNHARAKAYMESTIWFTDGFVVITGEIGAGKTTLIETFLRELEKDVIVAQIHQTQVSAIEFLQAVLVQFGFTPFKMKKAELIATLNNFLIEQYAAGRKVLLIVDEAQNLSLRVLEEIRMLSGVETTKEKVLRIILAGQPELNDKLDSPELVQLAQRVRLRFHLTALSEQDLQAYVLHRLEVAGSGGRKIFMDEIYPLLYRYTGGVPRLVNTLCETAMMAAFAQDRDYVTEEDLLAAVEELQWVEFDKRRKHLPATGKPLTPSLAATHAPYGGAGGAGGAGGSYYDGGTTGNLAQEEAVARAGNGHGQPPAQAWRPGFGAGDEVFARIIVATEGQTSGELPLRLGRTVVGRTADNDLQIDSRFVSRHHCQIITTRDSCVIEDLNSTNGILVKAKRVRHHNLNDGDVVTIGKHDLIYVDERVPRNRAAAPTDDPTVHTIGGEPVR